MKRIVFTGLFAAAVVTVASAQTTIIGYVPERHERFIDDRGGEVFIAEGNDLSGVGRTASGGFATHIGDGWFLSSASAGLRPGDTVTFTSASISTQAVEYGFRVGLTDLWLGKLDASPGDTVASYAIASDLLDGEALLAVGSVAPGDPSVFSVGVNTASGVGAIDTTSFYEAPIFSTLADDTTPVPDVAIRGTQEVGAPTFVERDGELALAGLHWRVGTDNYVAPHTARIGTLMGFDAPVVIEGRGAFLEDAATDAVPEPGTATFLALALGAGLVRRRR